MQSSLEIACFTSRHVNKCSRIIQMAGSMIPPMALIFLPKKPPITLPNKKPTKEKENVTIPMTTIGVRMSVCRKTRLKPTIKASMLSRWIASKGYANEEYFPPWEFSFLVESKIMLEPIKTKRPKAIQWSIPLIRSSNSIPANHPITGIIIWNKPKKEARTSTFCRLVVLDR